MSYQHHGLYELGVGSFFWQFGSGRKQILKRRRWDFSPLPEISLQDHDVLNLYLFQPVPLDQSVKVSIENQNKSHQGNKQIVKLTKKLHLK